jgi:hypothetical protein
MNRVVAIKDFQAADWQKLLNDFADKVADHTYKKIEYMRWRCLKPADQIIKVCLSFNPKDFSPYIDICNGIMTTTVTAEDRSFGEFLFEHIFNEEERNMAYNIVSDAAKVAALEVKADYCEGLTATSASVSGNTTKTVDIDLNKILSIDGDVAINGNLYTKPTITDSDYRTTNTIDSSGQAGISSWINVDLSTRPTFSDVERMIIDTIDKNNKKQEKEEMKGFNFDFGPCTGDQVRMSMYGLAVKNAAGTYVSYNPKSGEIVDVDVLNFDGAKFMYKIPVAIKEIAVGDIIVHNRKPMFVTALPAEGTTAITCVDVCAGEQKHVIPTVNMFGFNFVTKIVSLFNTVGDNAPTPDAPFGNMLPFMLMNEGTDKIDPMMMIFMMGGKMDMSNPMMMYFMLKDNKDTDMLPLLFMMQNK